MLSRCATQLMLQQQLPAVLREAAAALQAPAKLAFPVRTVHVLIKLCFEIQSHHAVYLASHAHLRHWMPSLPGHLLMPFARKLRSLSFTNSLLEPGLNVLQISSRDHYLAIYSSLHVANVIYQHASSHEASIVYVQKIHATLIALRLCDGLSALLLPCSLLCVPTPSGGLWKWYLGCCKPSRVLVFSTLSLMPPTPHRCNLLQALCKADAAYSSYHAGSLPLK